MKISEKGLELLKRFEGCRLIAYQDIGGKWTIGYGHIDNVSPRDVITSDQADALLRLDVERFEKCLNEYVKVQISQNQFDALVCFAFNVGCQNFKTSTLLKYLNTKDFIRAADELKRWIYCNHIVSQGLYNRRMRERNLFITGEYV